MPESTYNLGTEISRIPDSKFRDVVNELYIEIRFNFRKELSYKYLLHEDVYDNLDMIATLEPNSKECEHEIKFEARAGIISEKKIRKYLPVIREARQKMQVIGTSENKEGLARALDAYLQFFQGEFGKKDALEIFLAEFVRTRREKIKEKEKEEKEKEPMPESGKLFDIKTGERIG